MDRMDRSDEYWAQAHLLAAKGDVGNTARFMHLALRIGCGNECVNPGAVKPGGQQTNGGCRCKEFILSLLREVRAAALIEASR